MTALPPDETLPTPQISLNPATTLPCEKLGRAVKTDGEEREEVYTSCHAAEFTRRGACMVVWPGDTGSPTSH